MNGKHIIITSLLAFALAFSANAHQGSVTVYTNHGDSVGAGKLPSYCISNGIMVCHRYNPLFYNGAMKNGLEPRDKSGSGVQNKAEPGLAPSNQGQIVKLNHDGICLVKGDLDYAGTMRFELFFTVDECLVRGGRSLHR